MNIIFLTGADYSAGLGHITRCSSIYKAFVRKKIIPTLFVNTKLALPKLLPKQIRLNWINEFNEIIRKFSPIDVFIIDSYKAELDTYQALSKHCKLLVSLDDNKRLKYPRGLVVNGTVLIENKKFPINDNMLGADYIPLRPQFWKTNKYTISKKINNIMITFGGTDPHNMTPQIVKLLQTKYPDINQNIIIGNEFKNKKKIAKLKNRKTKFIRNPNAIKMCNVMINSDLAITAAGQTLYELARVGTPTIAIQIANNQKNNINGFKKAGFIEFAGNWDNKHIKDKLLKCILKLNNPIIRKNKSDSGRKFVDGQGSNRIVERIIKKLKYEI